MFRIEDTKLICKNLNDQQKQNQTIESYLNNKLGLDPQSSPETNINRITIFPFIPRTLNLRNTNTRTQSISSTITIDLREKIQNCNSNPTPKGKSNTHQNS